MSGDYPQHPFLLSVEELAGVLKTNPESGLTSTEVTQLQEVYPKNELEESKSVPWWKILARQAINPMVVVSVALRDSVGLRGEVTNANDRYSSSSLSPALPSKTGSKPPSWVVFASSTSPSARGRSSRPKRI